MNLIEEIKAKAWRCRYVANGEKEAIYLDDVLKILQPVLAHLQNRPHFTRNYQQFKDSLNPRFQTVYRYEKWAEQLDKLIQLKPTVKPEKDCYEVVDAEYERDHPQR